MNMNTITTSLQPPSFTPVMPDIFIQSHNPPLYKAKYPILQSYGIPTGMNTHENEIRNILGELVTLFKAANKPLTFRYGNHRHGEAVVIPRCKDKRTYYFMQHKEKWLDRILQVSISSSKDDIDSNATEDDDIDDAVHYLCETLFKKHEFIFRAVAKKFGMNSVLKLTEEQCLSLQAETNINESQFNGICKHMKVAFGTYIQKPRKSILKFSGNVEDFVDISFGKFDYCGDEKEIRNHKLSKNKSEWERAPDGERGANNSNQAINSKQKKPEKISYAMCDFTQMIAMDMQRKLEIESKQLLSESGVNDVVQDKIDLPTYGYPHVDVVIGCDHGAGSSRFVLKINYLSPQVRRDVTKLEYG